MAIQVDESFADDLGLDLKPINHFLSTGCTVLDLAIADRLPGGFAAGRISHIYGPESSAKSVLLQEPMGAAQRYGGIATMLDQEGTFDWSRAGLFGVNTAKDAFDYTDEPMTIECLFDKKFPDAIKRAKELGKPCVVGIDSLSSIPSIVEINESLSTPTYGQSRPQQLSKGFRKTIGALHGDLALLFVDQTRKNVSGMGPKLTVSGGEALKFYASTRVFVEKKANIENKSGKVVGVEVHFRITKNKVAPPYREGSFYLLFNYGIDNIRTNLQWLKDNTGEVSEEGDETKKAKKSPWFHIPGTDSKFNSMEKAVAFVEENELETVLDTEVWEQWKVVYALSDRKKRVRI